MLNKKALAATAGAADKLYVEDVFSTYLYTGNGSTQTITNGIDLSGEGGLVWIKCRDRGDMTHALNDTNRGVRKYLATSSTAAEVTNGGGNVDLYAYNTNGFNLGPSNFVNVNDSGQTFASWTFRKAKKFFDVVTYTGDNTNNRQISHSLGSAPGFIVVKNITNAQSWICYHRSLGTGNYIILNSTGSSGADANAFPTVTSTYFVPTANQSAFTLNTSGDTFVAYLFAHDAGGFGDSGSDNVISCGSFTADGSGYAPTVNLGYEPQWVLFKRTDSSQFGGWNIIDTMRGWVNPGGTAADDRLLFPNTSGYEDQYYARGWPTSTGFYLDYLGAPGSTHIYIAIRRGPMKTPEAGTEVFEPFVDRTSIGNKINGTMGPVDLTMQTQVSTPFSSATHFSTFDRLRGNQKLLATSSVNAEGTGSVYFDTNQGVRNESWFTAGGVGYNFKRAPGFFDVVCYTGTGSATTVSHNLGVVPEMMIVKSRDQSTRNWAVYHSSQGNTKAASLNLTNSFATTGLDRWNSTTPTSTVFYLGDGGTTNTSAGTYVAYLFASITGISKVGSYTGNGSSQTINCGFTGGARFVMIKRADDVGDWVVFDSARGIVSGNDPYLELNTTDAEVTDKDAVDTDNTGFVVNETSGPNINTNSATYIYLAIA